MCAGIALASTEVSRPRAHGLARTCDNDDRRATATMYQVVIDTNVLVAALRSRRGASFRLLDLLGDPR